MSAPLKLVNANEISTLLKVHSKFAFQRIRYDKTFPRPVQGGVGQGKHLWALASIMEWKKGWVNKQKVEGAGAVLDLEMARDFLSKKSGK
jgi:predicted DNA-binding transcriptional regulator AlpA